MAKTLHGSARITPQIRTERQGLKENTGALARRYGLSRTTTPNAMGYVKQLKALLC